ncbi:MAG TPA: response regulator [Polyangiaceae bacterium]|nr:response regulator [Polyangiaceae bacterium]
MTATILIVDDSLTVRMDLADVFAEAEFRALPCEGAAQARKILDEHSVDAVVLDVVLADGNGIELLRELRDRFGAAVPVLMLSSEAEVRDRLRALEVGANEYVGKPYDRGYVVARTRELLRSRMATGSAEILLIDDSATFRAELGAALRAANHLVATATTGEEGLRLAAAKRPAAIIVDGVLPGMDGPSVIRRVRLDAALRSVPCILLTGESSAGEELRALDSGADAFVHKGDDPEIMLAKIHAVLRTVGESKDAAGTTSLLGPKKILTVDDSVTFSEELKRALHGEGYDIVSVYSGEDALALLSLESVDCILLDVVMPGIGGKETCRRIKNSPLVRDIPIIMLTGLADRASMLEGLALGADDYIEKSAAFEVLRARVQAQLRRRQFEDETRRVREQLLRSEIATSEARAARELAETRAQLVSELERKNKALSEAYGELQATQSQLVHAAKMASLGELVAGVAHEINNPLAFSLAHLATSRKILDKLEAEAGANVAASTTAQFERARSRLQESSSGLHRIQELVVKLRTFSRLDEGYRKQVSIRECVESVLTILEHRTHQGIRVEVSFGEPDVIDCYPSLLNQAIMNLVANSIDAAANHEQGLIEVRTGAKDGLYVIEVSDNGAGIPNELRERVFEPFFTTKPVGEGTGLGLSITYSIVRKHGGTLELRGREGPGTSAFIRIPLELA